MLLHNKDTNRSISVAIIYHDHIKYIEECIDSVAKQTYYINDIKIISDSSSSNYELERLLKHEPKISLVKTNFNNPLKARKLASSICQTEFILFLDADNAIPKDFIEKGISNFKSSSIAAVYSDLVDLKSHQKILNAPEFDPNQLCHYNYIDANSIWRSSAISNNDDVWDKEMTIDIYPEDYYIAKEYVRRGWEFKKQQSHVLYRKHDEQRSISLNRIRTNYFKNNGLYDEEVTIAILLFGDKESWKEQRLFLDNLEWNENLIKIRICDASNDKKFHSKLLKWAGSSKYSDIRLIKHNINDDYYKQDINTSYAKQYVNKQLCHIYNKLSKNIDTNYVLFLEEGKIPDHNILVRFFKELKINTMMVCGIDKHKQNVYKSINKIGSKYEIITKTERNENIVGFDFGCMLMRKSVLDGVVFRTEDSQDFETIFFQETPNFLEINCEKYDFEIAYAEDIDIKVIPSSTLFKNRTIASNNLVITPNISLDHTTNPSILTSVDQLAIIAVHYNPQRYCLPVRNYWEWRQHLGPLQQCLHTVELSFDGYFAIYDAEHISGGPQNVMWQKEAMINRAIRSLPPKIRFVAWIDHDLIFENGSWPTAAVNMLTNGYDVIQLFETWEHLGPTNNVIFRRNGSAAAKIKGKKEIGPVGPGGAWAARREYLERIGGLAYSNIIGGGDQLASDAWLGDQSHYMDRFAGKLANHDKLWQHKANVEIKGKVGFVAGNVRHLYHGDRSKRKYADRAEILCRHDFDPEKDIRIASSGILEWCSDKPQLHKEVADYFASREEDE